jgi:hypothetical protein
MGANPAGMPGHPNLKDPAIENRAFFSFLRHFEPFKLIFSEWILIIIIFFVSIIRRITDLRFSIPNWHLTCFIQKTR